jgi:hypothetical protein
MTEYCLLKHMKKSCLLLLIIPLLLPVRASASTILSVPFTSQAPLGSWEQPWQDACEETSITMIDAFYRGDTDDWLHPNDARDRIGLVVDVKTEHYGYSHDEKASDITLLINNFFSWEAHVVHNPSIALLMKELDQGRPIILPVYAPALKNPYYSGFFEYHVIVLSGYDDKRNVFIAQDPGTRKGRGLLYSYETIMNAMHDYLPGNTRNGRKVAIFTTPTTTYSAYSDGDKDGIPKVKELELQTSLITKNVKQISPSHAYRLLKSPNNPKVFLVKDGKKRHIRNEVVFLRNGFAWGDIKVISNTELSLIPESDPLI